jgi:transcription elongation GreA/GreB family factor
MVPGVELNKATLRDELLERLRGELDQLEGAHRAALEGATHEESRPENSKDTRALEQSYLARGQALRVADARRAVADVAAMWVGRAGTDEPVAVGALVTTTEGDDARVMLLAPHGGGSVLAAGRVHVVTPQSPLGRALLGRRAGETCELRLGGRERVIEVVEVA